MTQNNSIIHRLNVNKDEVNILHDLMPYKVKEILLIAHIYDALSIEQEGRISNTILGNYNKMNLGAIPRITRASTYQDAVVAMENRQFDMVIIMAGIYRKMPLKIAKTIKARNNDLPVYLVLSNPSHKNYFQQTKYNKYFDNLFVWNGDTKIFFSIVKMQEDRYNIENDIEKIKMPHIILLVENNPQHYSIYMPILYHIVMRQTMLTMQDNETIEDNYDVLKMRLRPKIILAKNYNEAITIYNIYNRYSKKLLCLISDVAYEKDGVKNKNAGFELIRHIKQHSPELPTALKSASLEDRLEAEKLNSHFLYKKSELLNKDIKNFIITYLGFGDFIFRTPDGKEIGRARNIDEFHKSLKTIPAETLKFHFYKKHFSLWLKARGEINLSTEIYKYQNHDDSDIETLRNLLINKFYENKVEQNKGQIISLDDPTAKEPSNIVQLAKGELGGKARGLAFINKMIHKFNIADLTPGINIKTPVTFFIGTDEFDNFIENNNLYDTLYNQDYTYQEIKEIFINAKLSDSLTAKLSKILDTLKNPIAIRSSGLFEDSLMKPFAGVFETYLLPNSHDDKAIRLTQVANAIKLVFSSVFSERAKSYIKNIDYKIENEKMAVVLQEVVGQRINDVYMPHISGTAQSFNYYPYGNIKPEDGSSVLALGLGMYVVEGEKAMRFCPRLPKIQNHGIQDIVRNTQQELFVVDLNKKDIDLTNGETAGLKRMSVREAKEADPTNFRHCLSIYDPNNDIISPGIDRRGALIVDFGNIIKYEYIPLAKTIQTLLNVMKEAMGTPVEIEFSINLNKENGKAQFYLLQVKPLIGNEQDYSINFDKVDIESSLILSRNSMGNGRIKNIKNIICVSPEDFNNLETEQIAEEIKQFNEKLSEQNEEYLLVGPGRWGSRDKFIGVPVQWSQISKAKIIVEAGLPDLPLEASSGSHFFHNVTSMNVAYISIAQNSKEEFINWQKINKLNIYEQGKYVKHIKLQQPLDIQIDGKKRITVVSENKNNIN